MPFPFRSQSLSYLIRPINMLKPEKRKDKIPNPFLRKLGWATAHVNQIYSLLQLANVFFSFLFQVFLLFQYVLLYVFIYNCMSLSFNRKRGQKCLHRNSNIFACIWVSIVSVLQCQIKRTPTINATLFLFFFGTG